LSIETIIPNGGVLHRHRSRCWWWWWRDRFAGTKMATGARGRAQERSRILMTDPMADLERQLKPYRD
jgi:hypothetical protein